MVVDTVYPTRCKVKSKYRGSLLGEWTPPKLNIRRLDAMHNPIQQTSKVNVMKQYREALSDVDARRAYWRAKQRECRVRKAEAHAKRRARKKANTMSLRQWRKEDRAA